jgi:kynureninase
MLSLLALADALSTMAGVSAAALRAKGIALTSLFIDLVRERCPAVTVASPLDPARRGSQVSLRHESAYALVRALIERNVIGDFRAPDIARFGFAPAYVSFVDVWDAVDQLADVLDTAEYRRPRFSTREAVT